MTLQCSSQPEDNYQQPTALYSLEPVGIGTAYGEGLNSYIPRLSNAHCVKTGDLIKKIILPLFEKDYLLANEATYFFDAPRAVNGMSGLTPRLVEILAKLTGRRDIHGMTLLNCSKILNDSNLIKKHQAWCPQCYYDWRESNRPVYQPLLWNIQSIEICDIHKIALEEECPECHKKIPIIARGSMPGFCSNCGIWLGRCKNKRNLLKNTEYYKYQRWITQQVGWLISQGNIDIEPIGNGQFAKNMAYLISLSDNKLFLDIYRMYVKKWSRGDVHPQLKTLLEFSYFINLPVADLFFNNIKMDANQVEDILSKKPYIREKKIKVLNHSYIIKNCLENELQKNEVPYPSLREISERMGYSEGQLRKYCPDLCLLISDRSKNSYIKYREEVRNKQQMEIKQQIFDLHSQGIRPTFNMVRSILPKNYFNFKQEGYQTWRETCIDLGYL